MIFRFDLSQDSDSGEWHGIWQRPESFASDGDHFAQLTLPAKVVRSMAGLVDGDAVEVSFNDPRPGAIPDIFRFSLIDPDAAEMTYVGTGLRPYLMQRVAPDTPLGPFKPGVTYARSPPRESQRDAQQDGPSDLPPLPSDPNDFKLPSGAAQGR